MTLTEGRYRWNGTQLRPAEGATLALLVADSFLIHDGVVVAPELHRARFLRDADFQGMVNAPTAFVDAAFAALPASGLWFPRFDLTERGELELWIRPAPALGSTLTLWTSPEDPRTEPRIKGPDIPVLAQLREQAQEAGADEAVLVDSAGYVADGATTCFVWWRDEVLHVAPESVARIDSVTVREVLTMAAERGCEVREEAVTPADLAGAELWALNALHGIRGVARWLNGPSLLGNDARRDSWQKLYWTRGTIVGEGETHE